MTCHSLVHPVLTIALDERRSRPPNDQAANRSRKLHRRSTVRFGTRRLSIEEYLNAFDWNIRLCVYLRFSISVSVGIFTFSNKNDEYNMSYN